MAVAIIKLLFSREAQPPNWDRGSLGFGAPNLPRTPSKQGFCCHLLAVEGHTFRYTNDLESALPPKSPKEIFRESEVSSGIMIIPSGPLVLQMRKFLFMIGFCNPKEYSVRDRHPESPGSQGPGLPKLSVHRRGSQRISRWRAGE